VDRVDRCPRLIDDGAVHRVLRVREAVRVGVERLLAHLAAEPVRLPMVVVREAGLRLEAVLHHADAAPVLDPAGERSRRRVTGEGHPGHEREQHPDECPHGPMLRDGALSFQRAPGVGTAREDELMDQFQGRVAVITGGGGGIGSAMARAFAARGARLVLADLTDATMCGIAEELRAGGADVLTVPTDVTSLDSVRALADAAERRFGAVHIVCNNAGIATFGEIAYSTHADWEYTMG